MDQSSTFARHFSRLVWLLMNEGGSVDEQKMALRALVQVSKVGAVDLSVENWELRAGDAVVPGVLTGVQDLVAQMAAHSVRALHIDPANGPADLLGLARIMAAGAVVNDGGANVKQKLAALAATGISFVAAPATQTRASEAITAPKDLSAPAASEPPVAPAPPDATAAAAAAAAAAATPAPATPPVSPAPAAPAVTRKMSEASAALLAQLSGRSVSTLSPEELLGGLDKTLAAGDVEPSNKLLDDLVTLAEHSARIGKPKIVAEIIQGVITRHAKLADGELKSAMVLAVRRLSKPALLRAVAGLITRSPERKQLAYEVLQATGEDGADAVIEQVGQARSGDERKSVLEVLTELNDAVPALMRMLGDSRWFVVRNSADLLGEMVATRAEDALVGLLRHADDRVRRSAASALLRLGTPDAVKSVYDAMNDESPEVRMQVAAAIATRKDAKTSATLIRAIDGENDGDVQLAMIAALGKVATPDAVQKLVKLAEAEGRLFRKKDSAMRVAAVQALVEARSPAAVNALRELVGDKDREVRETATRALAQIGR
jgi:HEAT repeat protein